MAPLMFAGLKRHRQLLPVLFLTGLCITSIIDASTNNLLLTTSNYMAFGAVALNFLAYFLFRSAYKYLFAATVITGLFNLIVFTASEWTFSFSINSLTFTFQPQALIAGLIAYLTNFRRINEYLLPKQAPEEAAQYEQARFLAAVEKFRDQYSSYATEQLHEIAIGDGYLPEAQAAARQVLAERQLNASR